MGKDDEKEKRFVWLKTEPKLYGLFEIGDDGARWLGALAIVVVVILIIIWLL